MTQVAEKNVVAVLCLGIATEVGFALTPAGFDQSFASFKPGVPLEMEKHYADFLIEQDSTRFQIVEKKISQDLPPAAASALANAKAKKATKAKKK